ncbi:hypothetical protein Tco_0009882 [Tanacetum coccineum]
MYLLNTLGESRFTTLQENTTRNTGLMLRKSVAKRNTRHQRNLKEGIGKKDRCRRKRVRLIRVKALGCRCWFDTERHLGQTQQCKMTTAGQGMIQMLMMQISNPYMTKRWLRVDQYPKKCQVSPMIDSSPDNQTTEYSKNHSSLRIFYSKRLLPNFNQKDISRKEALSIASELKYQNQALKSGQRGQILNETSNKAKIEKEIDVLEIMNIELGHSVAKLRKENETLKQHYKDLYDSIKITRSKTTEQTTTFAC